MNKTHTTNNNPITIIGNDISQEYTITVNYLLNEEGQKLNKNDGGDSKMLQSIKIVATEKEIEVLEECRCSEGCYNIGFFSTKEWLPRIDEFGVLGVPTEYYCYNNCYHNCEGNLFVKCFNKPMRFKDLLKWEKQRQGKLSSDKARILKDYFEKKQMFNKEMRDWTITNGSNSLKNYFDEAYDVTILYLSERLSLELPGYENVPNNWYLDNLFDIDEDTKINEFILDELNKCKKIGYKASVKRLVNNNTEDIFVVCVNDYLGENLIMKRCS